MLLVRRLPLLSTCVLIVGLIIAVLTALTCPDPPDRVSEGDGGVIRHFLRWGIAGDPRPRGAPRRITPDLVQPGDLILGSRPGNAYGAWTHVAICIGPDAILGQDLQHGMYPETCTGFCQGRWQEWAYDRIRILRPRVDAATRNRAAARAATLLGTPFHTLASTRDQRIWTCCKAVWWAYAQEGLDLVPGRGLLIPDDFADNPLIAVVQEGGVPVPDPKPAP